MLNCVKDTFTSVCVAFTYSNTGAESAGVGSIVGVTVGGALVGRLDGSGRGGLVGT